VYTETTATNEVDTSQITCDAQAAEGKAESMEGNNDKEVVDNSDNGVEDNSDNGVEENKFNKKVLTNVATPGVVKDQIGRLEGGSE
jgi:hypothetical protein